MVYITAIRMSGGNDHEHIAMVRWRNPSDGKTGESTRETMVDWIDNKSGDARVQGKPTDARVGVVEAKPRYLRTYAD